MAGNKLGAGFGGFANTRKMKKYTTDSIPSMNKMYLMFQKYIKDLNISLTIVQKYSLSMPY